MTATVTMQRLLADLQVDIPGAVQTTLQSNLYRAADEFFLFTNVWTEDQNVSLVANQLSYVLTPPAQGRFARALNYYDPADAQKRWADNIAFTPPTGLLIATAPSSAGTRVITLAKTVIAVDADNNPDYPDIYTQAYREVLYDGARRYLHSMPGMPWTDMKLAALYGQKFTAGKTVARVDAIKANVRGQTNWAYPQQYSTGRQRG